MEQFLQNHIRTFNDSQSAVGILTLHWADDAYRGVVSGIKNAIKTLGENGIYTDILWTPGHSEIKGK